MGLDGVEMIMDIEKTFDISISDEEAGQIITVNDLHECVWKRVEKKKQDKSASAILFYKLRREFVSKGYISRSAFHPETDLNIIIPIENRKSEWLALKENLGLELPRLVFDPVLMSVLAAFQIVFIVVNFIMVLIAVIAFDASLYWWFCPVLGIFLAVLMDKIFSPIKIYFEEEHVRNFIEKIIQMNFKKITSSYGVNRQEIIKVINLIIQDKSGVEMHEIKPEATLVYDLGIN